MNDGLYYFHRYFIGIPQAHPGQRHLYRVNSQPPHLGSSLHAPVCITCTPVPYPEAQYNSERPSKHAGVSINNNNVNGNSNNNGYNWPDSGDWAEYEITESQNAVQALETPGKTKDTKKKSTTSKFKLVNYNR